MTYPVVGVYLGICYVVNTVTKSRGRISYDDLYELNKRYLKSINEAVGYLACLTGHLGVKDIKVRKSCNKG